MPNKRVFLCHSSADKPFVDRLANDLTQMNVGVWYDKWEIKLGDSILTKISEGIESHDYLAIILSKTSVQSDWVRLELNAGLMKELEEKEVFVLPLLLEDCKVPVLLKDKRRADFKNSYEDGFEELLFKIFPDSEKTITRTKEFRSAQYLISGLAATDNNGTNTLNETQLRFIFKFRNEFKNWLGTEEKRLLFWSAVAFKYSNRNTPDFMEATVPVWCFIDKVDDPARANWILESLNGVLFDFMIPYYSWACKITNKFDFYSLLNNAIERHKAGSDLFNLGEMKLQPKGKLIEVWAKDNPVGFKEVYLDSLPRNLSHPTAPFVVEAISYLPDPWVEDKLFEFQDIDNETLAFSAFKGLTNIRSARAVNFLRGRMRDKSFKTECLDESFNLLTGEEFADELKAWLKEENKLDISARILVSLSNSGNDLKEEIFKIHEQINGKDPTIRPTTVRLLGRTDEDALPLLETYFDDRDLVLSESAIFAYAKIAGNKSFEKLKPLLKSQSETVLCAASIALCKYSNENIFPLIKDFNDHNSPKIRSVFYRLLSLLRPSTWPNYLDSITKETIPLVKFLGCRSIIKLASEEQLNNYMKEERFGMLEKSVFDAQLFSRFPFTPGWLDDPDGFEKKLIKSKSLFAVFDLNNIYLDTNCDLTRTWFSLDKKFVT